MTGTKRARRTKRRKTKKEEDARCRTLRGTRYKRVEKRREISGLFARESRHLSTTRPCSAGEKTRQPCTHLVSSGPSIRRRGYLLSISRLRLPSPYPGSLTYYSYNSQPMLIGDRRQLSNYRHLPPPKPRQQGPRTPCLLAHGLQLVSIERCGDPCILPALCPSPFTNLLSV